MIWCLKAHGCAIYFGLKSVSARSQRLFAPCRQKIKSEIRRDYETQIKSAKDIILYKYENPRFYKYLNIFGVVQFLIWSFLGRFSVSTMRDVPVEENIDPSLPWWKKINLGEGKYKNSLAIVCYAFGFCLLASSWMFTLRSVRYLILNKGGDKVSIVCYSPSGENRILTVPLDKVSCTQSRSGAKSTLPLKVFGHRFYYLLDMKGEFKNGPLFDRTAGMMRKF